MSWTIPVNVLEPTPDEIDACRRTLDEQVTSRRDSYIVAVAHARTALDRAATAVLAEDRYAAFREARAMLAAQQDWQPAIAPADGAGA
jgi:hypothetical protein